MTQNLIPADESTELELARMQRKINEAQILTLLQNLPATKYAIPDFEAMDRQLNALQKTITRLKGFIAFLSKLNPMEYLRWMADAFSGYRGATKAMAATTETTEAQKSELSSSPSSASSYSVRSGKMAAKRSKKAKSLLPS